MLLFLADCTESVKDFNRVRVQYLRVNPTLQIETSLNSHYHFVLTISHYINNFFTGKSLHDWT